MQTNSKKERNIFVYHFTTNDKFVQTWIEKQDNWRISLTAVARLYMNTNVTPTIEKLIPRNRAVAQLKTEPKQYKFRVNKDNRDILRYIHEAKTKHNINPELLFVLMINRTIQLIGTDDIHLNLEMLVKENRKNC